MADAQALLLQVSADTSKAEKRLKAFEDKLKGVGKTVDKISNDNQRGLNSLFGKPGQALDKIFDSTRFKVLDTGAARVGLFGSSLEKLGIAGLGAAAGIGAVAFALHQAGEAIKFADELEDTANRLHVTTDALQEYRYAIRALGGDEKGADEALEAFSSTLGKAQAGLPKAIKAFKELGFTDAQIKGFTDVESTLTQVNEKISKLKSPAQKDAVVDQLGLTGLKQAVEGLPEDFARARAEAHKMGVVFDAELIRKASGLEDQLQTINERISVDMKSAFVSLGPVLVDLKAGLAGLLEGVLSIIDGFRSLQDRTRITLEGQLQNATQRNAELTAQYGTRIPMSKVGQFRMNQKVIAENTAQLSRNQVDEEVRQQAADRKAADARKAAGTSLVSQAKATGPSAQSQQKHFDDELAKIADKILAAAENERHSLEERAKIARQRLQADIKARDTSVDDQVATKAITAKQGERLKAENGRLAAVERSELNAEQVRAQEELLLRNQRDLAIAAADVLNAQLGLAHTAGERAAVEAEILAAQRAIARAALAQQLNSDPNKTPFQKELELGLFDAATAYQKGAKAADAWAKLAEEQARLADAQATAQLDALQLQDQLADTAKERRDVELKILEAQYRVQRATLLQAIAVENDTSKQTALQTQLKTLDDNHAGQAAVIEKNTRGPLEQFLAQVDSVDKLNEKLEELSVQGLQDVNDGIAGLITGTEKWGDVSKRVLGDILTGLIKLELQQAEAAFLPSLAGGLKGLPLIGGLFGGHRAAGGPVSAGVPYMVGERGRELFVPKVSGSIIPNHAVAAMAGMSGAAQSITVISPVHIHAEGSVGFKELVAGINGRIDASHQSAVKAAISIASRSLPGRAQQASRLGT